MIIAWLNSVILWIYGIVILIHVKNRWHIPEKQASKYSELVYVIAFVIIGFYIPFLFDSEGLSEYTKTILFSFIFIALIGIIFWLLVCNVLPEYLKIKKNPELIENDPIFTRKYSEFCDMMKKKYENGNAEDISKDLSRKALHFVLLGVVIGVHELCMYFEDNLVQYGLTGIALRNSLYIIAGTFFILMFTTSDLLRITRFHYLPLWAKNWYLKSLEAKTETWTVISSVPFLLTLLLFLFSPLQVLFCAAIVSCIADAVASIIGKSYGKHKMTEFGRFPHKSFEGLIAGALSAFGGVWGIFYFYPISGMNLIEILTVSSLCMFAFVYVDAFSTKFADNILNTLIPGMIVWGCMYLFI